MLISTFSLSAPARRTSRNHQYFSWYHHLFLPRPSLVPSSQSSCSLTNACIDIYLQKLWLKLPWLTKIIKRNLLLVLYRMSLDWTAQIWRVFNWCMGKISAQWICQVTQSQTRKWRRMTCQIRLISRWNLRPLYFWIKQQFEASNHFWSKQSFLCNFLNQYYCKICLNKYCSTTSILIPQSHHVWSVSSIQLQLPLHEITYVMRGNPSSGNNVWCSHCKGAMIRKCDI